MIVCAECKKPVQRTFDDDFSHVDLDDALACPTGDYDVHATRLGEVPA